MKTEKEIIAEIEAFIASECKPIDREARFDDMLDECYSFEKVGGIFAQMSPSRVLKEVDPIAYRCGVNDYEDSEGMVGVDGEYYDRDEAEKAQEAFLDLMRDEESDLESGIEQAESEDEPENAEEIASLQSKLAEKRQEITLAEKHSL